MSDAGEEMRLWRLGDNEHKRAHCSAHHRVSITIAILCVVMPSRIGSPGSAQPRLQWCREPFDPVVVLRLRGGRGSSADIAHADTSSPSHLKQQVSDEVAPAEKTEGQRDQAFADEEKSTPSLSLRRMRATKSIRSRKRKTCKEKDNEHGSFKEDADDTMPRRASAGGSGVQKALAKCKKARTNAEDNGILCYKCRRSKSTMSQSSIASFLYFASLS